MPSIIEGMGGGQKRRRFLSYALTATVTFGGCAPSKYRREADCEVYQTIGERNGDARWSTPDIGIDLDPRSRYYDPLNPDCSPMPPDDLAAHQYMHCVDGKKGWARWHENGNRSQVENPHWYQALLGYADVDETGTIQLDLEDAMRLAYLHSPVNQQQLETIYLSALDVTGERFALDTQFFGGYGLAYNHTGNVAPANIGRSGNQYVTNPASLRAESNRFTIGAPTANGNNDSALRFSRRYATAADLAVGFANSFVFEFNGSDANLSSSLINFTLNQPLLRGAGRDIALEGLTQSERDLLGTLRSYAQFRQGFYTRVAIGEIGVPLPQRNSLGTSLNIFSGLGGVNGYAGLLQQLQQIRNAEDNLELQVRTLERLEYLLAIGLIDLVQVDQFRQNVERDRASLLQSRNSYLLALDAFKTQTLGLPPDVLIDLEDDLIKPFQLTTRESTSVRDAVTELQDALGELSTDADDDDVQPVQEKVYALKPTLAELLKAVADDVDLLNQSLQDRRESMDIVQLERLAEDAARLDENFRELEISYAEIEADIEKLQRDERIDEERVDEKQADEDRTDEEPKDELDVDGDDRDTDAGGDDDGLAVAGGSGDEELLAMSPRFRDTVNLLRKMSRFVESAILEQAGARLESVSIDTIDLPPEQAYRIALSNRLDFMNARAALVDSWRQIEIRQDALQSGLNFTAGGDIRTDDNNPLAFNSSTGTARLGIRFDAPLTRLLERNQYREALITYQRSRRSFIQSRDSLHQGLRVLLREIERLKQSLEIQRRAVAIAIRRVDLTSRALEAPVRPPQPGQRAAQFGPTAAINLLSAQAALRDTQNAFLQVYISYYAAKMRLARELGVMSLDPDGLWVESPLPGTPETTGAPTLDGDLESALIEADAFEDVEVIPPPVEQELLEAADLLDAVDGGAAVSAASEFQLD